MASSPKKLFWISTAVLTLIFAALFAVRLDLPDKWAGGAMPLETRPPAAARDRDTWMNIFQNGRKIGFSHTVFTRRTTGYHLLETLSLRINTMGMLHDILVRTRAELQTDFALRSFVFTLHSGRFDCRVEGRVEGRSLKVQTTGIEKSRVLEIPLAKPPYLAAGIMEAARAADFSFRKEYTFNIFDPATMRQEPVILRLAGEEAVQTNEGPRTARKVILHFKGFRQTAWIAADGEVLKEAGLLGMTLKKTNRRDALSGVSSAGGDLTLAASVPANVRIAAPAAVKILVVAIGGVDIQSLALDGGRQQLKDGVLTVSREPLPPAPKPEDPPPVPADLAPEAFVQSAHPQITALADKLVAPTDTDLKKMRKLLHWIDQNIEKRPVISLPDALTTLAHRRGDCNEHAVLTAALARAAGIPARIETGLVYLDGRFYYHAWNRVYAGGWITADALFGQMPADATHIRLSHGDFSSQLDLITVIGRISLEILSVK